jgi:hypothetical protein
MPTLNLTNKNIANYLKKKIRSIKNQERTSINRPSQDIRCKICFNNARDIRNHIVQ